MFIFFHCYTPEMWDAQVSAGLINAHSGICFRQETETNEESKFNKLAAEGGELFDLVKENRFPFYIDRLQGGRAIDKYPYDMKLVNLYRDNLGCDFYGFQIHEWMSRLLRDCDIIKGYNSDERINEAIKIAITGESNAPYPFLEISDAEEIRAFGRVDSRQKLFSMAEGLFKKRLKCVNGMLLPCDSLHLSFPIELRLGVKRIMAKIGAQIPNTRIQLAYARGMAKAAGIAFGAYYEPFSGCLYKGDGENGCNERIDSSRSLQRRMYLYAYMAGASFLSENSGTNNTFYNLRSLELTPYGKMKSEFIRFTEKYGDIGKPFTPIAVIIPRDMSVLEVADRDDSVYLGSPLTGAREKLLLKVRRSLRKLFIKSGKMLGNETDSLLNGVIPDAIDIISEDFAREDLITSLKYEYYVNLSGSILNIKCPEMRWYNCDTAEIPQILERLLPCIIKGNSLKQFTKADDGSYYMLLTNNSGVVRTDENGEELMRRATEHQIIDTEYRRLVWLEGAEVTIEKPGIYHADIPAGGYLFAKIV